MKTYYHLSVFIGLLERNLKHKIAEKFLMNDTCLSVVNWRYNRKKIDYIKKYLPLDIELIIPYLK